MLTHQQILHFRTFGYVTLRGLLSPAQTHTLRQEVTGALVDAFGKIATEPNDLGGISGDYLPLAVNRAPFSMSLIADDRRTFQYSADLLGGPKPARCASSPALICPISSGACASTRAPSPPSPDSRPGTGRTSWSRPSPVTSRGNGRPAPPTACPGRSRRNGWSCSACSRAANANGKGPAWRPGPFRAYLTACYLTA